MSVAAYPEYRPSKLSPTGTVPAHWQDGSVKHGFDVTLGKMVVAISGADARPTRPYLRSANVQDGWLALDDVKEMWFSDAEAASLDLKVDDLVVCEGGDVGRCALLRTALEGYGFQNSINRVRRRGNNSTAYLAYWLNHLKLGGFIDVLCNRSTIAHYTAEKLAATPLLLPPPAEQSLIAAFLDQETGKIDALVAEQERLMVLLKEKRQAVISQVVTKGLNPNAKMKPSGVEWLGDVPEHWDVNRVKHAARLESGHTPSKQFPEYWEGGDIEWVSLNDSKFLAANDYISDTAEKITKAGLEHSSARLLPKESVVFTRDATIGLAAITTKPMAVSQHLIAWCPTGTVLPLYLLRVFNVMKPFLDAFTFGATIKTIGMPDVRKLVTPVPPLDEQREIVAFIDEQNGLIDMLIAETQRAIALLKERRAALISAAVTGKIDVRDLADTQRDAA